MPAALSAVRSASMRGLARSSGSPTQRMLRSGTSFSTTPGSITWLGELTTAPTTRCRPTALASAPPGSRRLRSGAGGRDLASPWPYHQGMPFCTKATAVSGPSKGPMLPASACWPDAFSVTSTASCGPRSAGRSDAFTLATIFLSPASRVSPRARIASRCAPRATIETSLPASASRAAKLPPMAPAPYTQIRMLRSPLLP